MTLVLHAGPGQANIALLDENKTPSGAGGVSSPLYLNLTHLKLTVIWLPTRFLHGPP